MLSASRGQGNFRRLEASRPRPRTWPSRPRISKCVLEAKDVLEDSTSDSSEARGGEGGVARAPPPIGLSTKMQNKKNITFLALLALFFALESTKKGLKRLLKYIFRRGANFSKIKLPNQWKLCPMAKNKQSNLIASVKMLDISFVKKYTVRDKLKNMGGYSILFNYQ